MQNGSQQLMAHDYENCREFCRLSLEHFDLTKILWSDEVTFSLNGTVQSLRGTIWSNIPPNVLFEKPLHSPSIRVWFAFGNGIVVPPYFFNETVNGERYLNMLNEHLLPFLREKNMIYYLSAGWLSTPYRQPGEGILDTQFQS